VAANGEDALEVAQRERPDLILLDVRMPELDGVETCGRLKTNDKTRSIPLSWPPPSATPSPRPSMRAPMIL